MTLASCQHSGQHAPGHHALLYRGPGEYIDGVVDFVRAALQAGEPVAIAIPDRSAVWLTESLRALGSEAEILRMDDLGRNPARIIPALREMLDGHGGRRLHFVGEPIWPGRSTEEIREATRHEALLNLAFGTSPIEILCPYDANVLSETVLTDARRTHPQCIEAGTAMISRAYTGPVIPQDCDAPLDPPPSSATALSFSLSDLRKVRATVAAHATAAGLDEDGVGDLVMAVNELAANSIAHAHAEGILHVWRVPGQIVCQVDDPGQIADPLAGRRTPTLEAESPRGLWMVNQVCDLVQLRSGAGGTTIRVHAYIA